MSKVWNIWIICEEIDEENKDNGVDIYTRKVKSYDTLEEAIDKMQEILSQEGLYV